MLPKEEDGGSDGEETENLSGQDSDVEIISFEEMLDHKRVLYTDHGFASKYQRRCCICKAKASYFCETCGKEYALCGPLTARRDQCLDHHRSKPSTNNKKRRFATMDFEAAEQMKIKEEKKRRKEADA